MRAQRRQDQPSASLEEVSAPPAASRALTRSEFFALSRPERVELLSRVSKDLIITIDGPAASGKSELGRRVLQEFGLKQLVDTGRYFRAFGYAAKEAKLLVPETMDFQSAEAEQIFCDTILATGLLTFEAQHSETGEAPVTRIFLSHGSFREELTSKLDTPDIAKAARTMGELGYVRTRVVDLQRMNETGSLVSIGRNQAEEVYPVKDTRFHVVRLYVDVPLAERARRRKATEGEIANRDYRDSTRATFPLLSPEIIASREKKGEVLGIHTESFRPEQGKEEVTEIVARYLDLQIWSFYEGAMFPGTG